MRGELLGVAPNGLKIYRIRNIRRQMRGLGWTPVIFAPEASTPTSDAGALDVDWHSAVAFVASSVGLTVDVLQWDDSHAEPALQSVEGLLSQLPGTATEVSVGPEDCRFRYCVWPTSEAVRVGSVVELLRQKGRRMWIERDAVPGPM
jgi:hypothetical protein